MNNFKAIYFLAAKSEFRQQNIADAVNNTYGSLKGSLQRPTIRFSWDCNAEDRSESKFVKKKTGNFMYVKTVKKYKATLIL